MNDFELTMPDRYCQCCVICKNLECRVIKDTTLFFYENPRNVIKCLIKHPPKLNFISNLKILSHILYLPLFSNDVTVRV